MDPALLIGVIGLVAGGIGMGLLTSLRGLQMKQEFPLWMVLYLVWAASAAVDQWFEFAWFVGASIVGGLGTGGMQALLFDKYRANNPWYADKMMENQTEFVRKGIPFALGMGAFWGLLFGGISWGISALVSLI